MNPYDYRENPAVPPPLCCCSDDFTDEHGNVYRVVSAGCRLHGVKTNYIGCDEKKDGKYLARRSPARSEHA